MFNRFVGHIFRLQTSHLQKMNPKQASDYTKYVLKHYFTTSIKVQRSYLRPYFHCWWLVLRDKKSPTARTTKRKCTAWRSTSVSALHRRVASFPRIAFWWRTALLGDVSIGGRLEFMGEVEWANCLICKEKHPKRGLVGGIHRNPIQNCRRSIDHEISWDDHGYFFDLPRWY